jgi:hypothetical protein
VALVPVLLASRGLTGEKDPTRIRVGDLSIAENVDFGEANLLQKEGGAVKVNSVALTGGPIMAGFDWWPTATVQRRVVATALQSGAATGKLYKDDMTGAFATTLFTGLPAGRVFMVEAGAETVGRAKKLFVFTGSPFANGIQVQVLAADGATTANLATPPADWTGAQFPGFGFLFRGQLAGGGNANSPHILYLSTGGDHEDFTGAGSGFLFVYPGEGRGLMGGITALGRGWLFKDTGIYFVNDAASSLTGWYVQPANYEHGITSPHALAQVDGATLAFLSCTTESIVLMQESSGTLTGVSFVDLYKALGLSTKIRSLLSGLTTYWGQLRWYPTRKQLHVTAQSAPEEANLGNRRVVIDFNSERTRVEVSNKENCSAIWMEEDSDRLARPRAGDASGFVRKLDQLARTVDGVNYTLRLRTTPTDFSDLDGGYMVKKLFTRLHLEFEDSGDYNLPITVYVDNRTIGTVQFNQSGAGGGAALVHKERAIAGEGRYFSMLVEEATDKNPRLARAWVEFEPTSVNQ